MSIVSDAGSAQYNRVTSAKLSFLTLNFAQVPLVSLRPPREQFSMENSITPRWDCCY